MSARSIGSLIITIGLVAIPVKLYTATSERKIAFNMLHAKPGCGSRLGQQLVCKAEMTAIERDDVVHGYEYAKDQYVTFSKAEMKALEAERDDSLEVLECPPATSVDLLQVESSKFIGPDTGGDRAYRLLSLALHDTRRVAVGRWKTKSKDTIVIIRPYGDAGLAMHQIFYASEVRDFEEVERSRAVTLHRDELRLAKALVEQLGTPVLDTSKYTDGWAAKILEQVERKVAGEEIVVAPPVGPHAQRFDLLEALQRSLHEGSPPARGPRKAASRSKAPRARRAG